MTTHRGNCFCGAVKIEVTGAPVAMGYCHCDSCRHWSAGPINAFTLWKPETVTIAEGEEHLSTFHKTEASHRRWCRRCGGHVLTDHPGMGLIDVYAAVLRDFRFEPQLHVHYGEAKVRVHDGLPKQRDMPAEMSGSGILLPE